MDRKDFRVMEAVEKGMRNHGLVPGPLVASLANLRHGGSGKIISSLLRDKLLSHESKKGGYDGYRLTNAGYDILALHNLKTRGFVAALGDRIGTGKESDVYLAVNKEGRQTVLKLHRLGRTSFRNVRKKRDYFNSKSLHTQPNSWLFLSRLSAIKEFAFMKALHQVGYPTPTPVAHNRHVVVMGLVRGVPLYQIIPTRISPEQAQSIFQDATQMAVRLARHGLVHCDLNEFNLLVDMSGIQSAVAQQEGDDIYVRHSGMSVAASRGALSGMGPWDKHYQGSVAGGEVAVEKLAPDEEDHDTIPQPIQLLENGEPKPVVTLIDFPQMVSTQHPNAQELYERDLECLRKFFVMKLQCQIPPEDILQHIVQWESLVGSDEDDDADADADANANGEEGKETQVDNEATRANSSTKLKVRLDVELRASGYSVEDSQRDLELFYFEANEKLMQSTLEEESDEGEDEDEDDEEYESNEEDNGNVEEVGNNTVNENIEDEGNNIHNDTQSDDDAKDQDKDDKRSEDEDEEGDVPEVENLLDSTNPITDMERQKLEEKARNRVRRQLQDQKKKGRGKAAFRSSNSNKNYVKGKRAMQDFGL